MIGISRLHFPLTTLGPGRRCGVWVQGCTVGCQGCVSRDTWALATSDQSIDVREVVDWIERSNPEGVTITGGEPFDQPEALLELMDLLRQRKETQSLSVLVYSGYSMGRLCTRHAPILERVDAVIAGPFVAGVESPHPWYGSGNQRLHVLNADRQSDFVLPDERPPSLQIDAAGGQLWITGIPRRGDLERMEAALAVRGVKLGDVSWRA